MSNIDFDNLSPLSCPLTTEPDNNKCSGELIREHAFNLAILERALRNSIIPAGISYQFRGALDKIPKGFIIADGSWYKPETFPLLFEALQYHYGKRPDGCFRVPDDRGVILVGMDLGSRCIGDLSRWTGFDAKGNPTTGKDVVGASNLYEQESFNGGENSIKERLVLPLLSTGEICM